MGQLSNALGKVNYKGTMGSTSGDLSSVIGQFVAQGKAEKEQATKDALDQALLGVKKSELGLQTKTLEHNVANDDRNFGFKQLEHGDTVENQRLAREGLEQNRHTLDENADLTRGMLERLGNRRADQGDQRIAQAGERIQIAGKKGYFQTDQNNDTYYYNPTTGKGSKLSFDANGDLVPDHPGAITPGGMTPMQPVSQPVSQPAAAAPATAATQGHGVKPDGAPTQPIQPGATEKPTEAHTVTADAPPGKPFKKPVPQNERNVAATFQQLKGLFSDVTGQIQGVNYQPPGPLTQFGIEMSKGGQIPMVPDAIEKIAGNTGVGMFAPKYQTLETSYNALSTFLTQMITGAQMSQQEADRIRSLVAMKTGDNPATVQLRLKQAQGIIDAAEAKVSPRAGGSDGSAPTAVATTGKGGGPEAKAHYDSLRAQGMSPEQALAETDKVFPR